ncbi:MAG: PhzF family phenazine biosynthesis protein [Paracoccus sp. (in: a-proteobacteria)]|nr:PhzF family phenazine biosynthesis protein [Paracoccus sp. (in: a-proteobacteria)]
MLDYLIYDVFTDQAFAGNPLAVVMGADGLSAAQMQAIAREFNLSETIFVMAPRDPANTARVRIFFPAAEIPFAGHPTIGCALHLSGGQDGDLVLEEEAGPVPVTIRGGLAEFTAPRLPVPHGPAPDPALIARALDLAPGDLGFRGHDAAVWQGGPAFLFVPLASLDALSRARPIEPHWSHLMAAAQVDSAYLYTPGGAGYRARMFSPTAGIPEDPATGSASALLAAQFHAAGDLAEGWMVLELEQGIEMGRPSQITMSARQDRGRLAEVRIRGRAVLIASGRIRIPQGAA